MSGYSRDHSLQQHAHALLLHDTGTLPPTASTPTHTAGCTNSVFGGAGSVLSLHQGLLTLRSCPGTQSPPCDQYLAGCNGRNGREGDSEGMVGGAFACTSGVLKDEAIELLRRFYLAGNPQTHNPKRLCKKSIQ